MDAGFQFVNNTPKKQEIEAKPETGKGKHPWWGFILTAILLFFLPFVTLVCTYGCNKVITKKSCLNTFFNKELMTSV